MCISSNFIELQAYRICEAMKKQSMYKMVKLELSDDRFIAPQNLENYEDGRVLITKAVLEDNEGKSYTVSPNHNGLRFVQGEITYREYRKIEKGESIKVISFLTLLIGLTITTMYLLKIFLL
ncbi:hypothetical protein MKX47_20680 [Solibacillus sp. FSL R7-0668]|uniref:hypothetical protein n=1 Tax=Solibacillus sp. FSL R7-0668 TaxID=2921688 RepID=UPI0030F63F32